jgi:hypothetical protein
LQLRKELCSIQDKTYENGKKGNKEEREKNGMKDRKENYVL